MARFDFNDMLHYRLLHTMYSKLARCKADLATKCFNRGLCRKGTAARLRSVHESAAIGRL